MRQLTRNHPYRYEDLLEDITYLKSTYPNLVQVENLGTSYDGREIPMLVIGHGELPIIITGGVHGRESINPMVLMRMVESYLELYKNNEPVVVDFGIPRRVAFNQISNRRVPVAQPFYEMDECTLEHRVGGYTPIASPSMQPTRSRMSRNVRNDLEMNMNHNRGNAGIIVKSGAETNHRFETASKSEDIPSEYNLPGYFKLFTFYIVPLVNPDGYEIALGGFNTIHNSRLREEAKKLGITATEWKANARGVDINRNFPSKTWRPKFEGDRPGSENETRALLNLFDSVPAVGYLDLHSRGKAIYYHKAVMSDAYNQRQLAIAKRLAKVTGYELMPSESEIEAADSGGNTVHYFSEKYGYPAFTIETVTDMEPFPLDVRHQTPTFEELYLVPLEFGAALMEEG